MNRKSFVMSCLIAVALVTMGQSSSCTAPMDATGTYSGNWSFDIKEGETVIDTVECNLSMTLAQDVTLSPPNNLKVTGTVFVDFTCLEGIPDWPKWLPIPEPTDIEVTGTMYGDGRIILGTGGCGPGTCIILGLDGQGECGSQTGGEIPNMTTYSGKWGLAVGIAFLGNYAVDGTFEVVRE